MMEFAADVTTSQRKILSQRSKKPDELDMLLESQGLYRKRMPRDGNSLFRSVADQLLGSQKHYPEVRTAILNYFMDNPAEVEQIMSRTSYPHEVSLVEYLIEKCLTVLRAVYRVNLKVYREPGFDKMNCYYMTDCASTPSPRQVTLSVDSELHWDSVYSHEHMKTMAFCQGTVYNMLYQSVFQLKNVPYAVVKMLDKSTKTSLQSLRDRRSQEAVVRMANGDYSEYDKEIDMKILVDQGIPPFPFKVAKSLDLNIYRNIEFDTWESCKGARGNPGGESVLQVGSKCLVRTKEDIKFMGYIQQLDEEKGIALVYVEQMGKIEEFSMPMLQPIPSFQARRKFRSSRRFHASVGGHWYRNSHRADALEMITQLHYQETVVEGEEVQPQGDAQAAAHEEAVEQHEYEDSYSADESDTGSDEETQPVEPEEPMVQQPMNMPEDIQRPYYTEPLYYAHPGYYPAYFPYTFSPVDMSVTLSYSVDGSDLPVNDMPTLRYFFNQGVQYVRSLRNNMSGSASGGCNVIAPSPMENVMGHGVMPVQAIIPPGTPITPGTPTEATFYCPQFYTQQQYQTDVPTFVQEGELVEGGQYYIPQYYVTTPATPPACHTAYVPQWPIFTP